MSTSADEYSFYNKASAPASRGESPEMPEFFTISTKFSTMDIQKIPWISRSG
jgi:hypothetical protein